ncbi:hypothetical protein ACOSP7_029875 [Xanthoceras sorbifolium]
MNKQGLNLSFIFLFFVFLVLSYTISARHLLPEKQGDQKEVKANGIAHATTFKKDIKEDLLNLMGSEECDEKDEDCLKRRMIAEAHLDYIYTQHHKP